MSRGDTECRDDSLYKTAKCNRTAKSRCGAAALMVWKYGRVVPTAAKAGESQAAPKWLSELARAERRRALSDMRMVDDGEATTRLKADVASDD